MADRCGHGRGHTWTRVSTTRLYYRMRTVSLLTTSSQLCVSTHKPLHFPAVCVQAHSLRRAARDSHHSRNSRRRRSGREGWWRHRGRRGARVGHVGGHLRRRLSAAGAKACHGVAARWRLRPRRRGWPGAGNCHRCRRCRRRRYGGRRNSNKLNSGGVGGLRSSVACGPLCACGARHARSALSSTKESSSSCCGWWWWWRE